MSEEPAFEELLKMTARAGDLVDEKAVLAARVAELEAICSRAYGMIAEGPATGISKQNMLNDIAKALRWKDVNRQAAQAVQALANWMEE